MIKELFAVFGLAIRFGGVVSQRMKVKPVCDPGVILTVEPAVWLPEGVAPDAPSLFTVNVK